MALQSALSLSERCLSVISCEWPVNGRCVAGNYCRAICCWPGKVLYNDDIMIISHLTVKSTELVLPCIGVRELFIVGGQIGLTYLVNRVILPSDFIFT